MTAVVAELGIPSVSIGTIAIRPENIHAMAAARAPSRVDGLPGKIVEVTFLGNLIDCYAALDEGTRVRLQVDANAGIEVGQPGVLHFEPRAVTVFEG